MRAESGFKAYRFELFPDGRASQFNLEESDGSFQAKEEDKPTVKREPKDEVQNVSLAHAIVKLRNETAPARVHKTIVVTPEAEHFGEYSNATETQAKFDRPTKRAETDKAKAHRPTHTGTTDKVDADGGLLKPETQNDVPATPESDITAAAQGVGSGTYSKPLTGRLHLDRQLMHRLRTQDVAVIILLVFVLCITVFISCLSVYQGADDRSLALYYSNPTNNHSRRICETNSAHSFLQAFNSQPRNVRLRIVGRISEPSLLRRIARSLRHSADYFCLFSRPSTSLVLFDVSLDLAPFVTGDGEIDEEDMKTLEQFLDTKNHLAVLTLRKLVEWKCWEDVATNIRQRLRSLGFWGEVEVFFEAAEEVSIFQNQQWSNFVRNRITQVLVALSVVGVFFWVPYVWARQQEVKIKARFAINLDPGRYWELVAQGLHSVEGFHVS